MENQMKLCFTSSAQFDKMWLKLFPSQRRGSELPTLSMYCQSLNTLFIVGKQEDFIATVESVLSESWLLSDHEKECLFPPVGQRNPHLMTDRPEPGE